MSHKTTNDQAIEIKRQFAQGIARAMKQQKVTQSELARRMCTSRAVVNRLLKADDLSITLTTMIRAVIALKSTLRIRAVP